MSAAHERLIAQCRSLASGGRPKQAEARLASACRQHPDDASLRAALGQVLSQVGRTDEAIALLESALRTDPGLPDAEVALARALLKKGDIGPARDRLRRLLVRAPAAPAFLNELAVIHETEGDRERTVAVLRRLLSADPDDPMPYTNLGELMLQLRRDAEALAWFDEAVRRRPEDAQIRYSRAFALLLLGRHREGWAAFEARLEPAFPESVRRLLRVPRWDGRPMQGRRLLVCAEQGLGDQILYSAYLSRLQAMGIRLLVETDPRLSRLFGASLPGAECHPWSRRISGGNAVFSYGWLPRDDPPEAFIELCSLPLMLGDSHANFVSPKGYLRPDGRLVDRFRHWLDSHGPGLHVGLFWRSGLVTPFRARFYPTIEGLEPVLKVPGVRFVSLQYDDDRSDIARIRDLFGVEVIRPEGIDMRNDLDGVVALTAALDGVISTTSTNGMIGGAVGTRTMIINSARSEIPLIGDRDAFLGMIERVEPPVEDDWGWVYPIARQRLEAWRDAS